MKKIYTEINADIEKFKLIVSESNGHGEICRKYNFPNNGQSFNIVKEFIGKLELDTIHFGLKTHKIKNPFINKECPVCKETFQTQFGAKDEKTYCSRKCANSLKLGNRHSQESKEKIRESIKKYLKNSGKILIEKGDNINTKRSRLAYSPSYKLICKYCKNEFISFHKKTQQYCSSECRFKCPEYRKKLSDSAKQKVANGTHKGWQSRNIISYPEKFFMKVLSNNNISYEHNKKVGKYFIDFAIVDKMIALEIDGKQHLIEDRKLKDIERDNFLTKNGWYVYRIQWNSINNENGKKLMKEKIDKFIQNLNHHQ